MMRFLPRLTWDLTRVFVAQKLLGKARCPLALRIDLAQFPAQPEVDPGSTDPKKPSSPSRDSRILAHVRASHAPLVWIGGDTPLHYPRIGHLAREIVNLRRAVFIEMDGTLLRRRIHEFRPVSRLYLVLPLNGLEDSHDERAGRAGSYRATIESIRTARLSGFHICVETTIFPDTDPGDLRALADFVSKLNVDGWIQKRPACAQDISEERLEAAHQLIPNPRWRAFSKLLMSEQTEFSPVLGSPHAVVGDFGNVKVPRALKVAFKHVPKEATAREEGLHTL